MEGVVRAAVITRPGGAEVLEIQERPVPVPGRGDILVRIRTSALNRADVLQRKGRYAAPPGVPVDIPGLEFAGEVAAMGEDVSLWRVGDRVCGLVAGGAHAEFVVTHERTVAAVPMALDWRSAGAAVEAFITAHDALIYQAGLRPGESVLVHAVGSGVGLAAVGVATVFGATVFGTARGEDKLRAAREAGMSDGIVPGSESIADTAMRWTDGRGVDVVLDLVGGDYSAASIAAMAPRGRLMMVGTLAGASATLDLGRILSRRLSVQGTVLRSRPLEERIVVTQRFSREVMPLLASGRLAMRIHETFELDAIGDAHRLMESNRSIGKIAINVFADDT
jgi:putative PIG3 family NAD(P)H quinone oxidoreductase